MWILLIETSTERGIVAIYHDEECRYFSCLPLGYDNSRLVIPKMEEGFKELNLKPKDIQLIVVGTGPGSYTGTRVGVVIAKTMAYAHKIPLVGVCSLEGFIPSKKGPFAVIVDAKLAGAILKKGSEAPELVPWDQVPSKLSDINLLVTPNATRIQPKIPDKIWEETAPDPLQMIKIGLKKYLSNDFSTDGQVEIIYLTQL